MSQELDFRVPTLGACAIPSPLTGIRFVRESERILYDSDLDRIKASLVAGDEPWSFEAGGPRERIFFEPSTLSCAIVTCGGLCPGLNDVIRATVMSLHHHYGVRTIYGFPFGYEGLSEKHRHEPVRLTPDVVMNIHERGGTILGSSRGQQDVTEMVDTLARMNIGILFAIGGDGTLRGALAIDSEAKRRGLRLSVIGIPKTIDNDVAFMQKTFGFETAVSEAKRATSAANAEAVGARNGVGLVKLMGRDSGFIAAFTALADNNVNFCLIPEVPFTLAALLASLRERLDRRGHAVIVVAEGAGQELMSSSGDRDRSGNVRYGDIGVPSRNTSGRPAWRSTSNTSIRAMRSGACPRIRTTRRSVSCWLTTPCTPEWPVEPAWSSGSGTIRSRTCRFRLPFSSVRRSTRKDRSGAAFWRRPVSRTT
jgi:6-phosphofructokinase 1